MHIVVTGGCGFVGANLVRALLKAHHTVTVLDNLTTGNRTYLEGLDVKLVVGDVRDPAPWEQILDQVDGIVHLAAFTSVPASIKNPVMDHDVNVRGTFNLLEVARKYDVSRFIFASSNAPIGRQPAPARESLAALPISPYGASKLAGEAYCMVYHAVYGMNTVALRFSNLYGRYAGHKESVVARFFKFALDHGKLVIYGDGHQTRDFIHVDDLVRGIMLALTAESAYGEVIQLGTGTETTVLTLAQKIQQLMPEPIAIEHVPPRLGDIYRNYSDISKARERLGFAPQITLDDGLRDAFDWFMENYEVKNNE